jgi:hypothetical protein
METIDSAPGAKYFPSMWDLSNAVDLDPCWIDFSDIRNQWIFYILGAEAADYYEKVYRLA